MDYVGGYCLSLDMTGSCLVGRHVPFPFGLSKAFDTSTPVSKFISPAELGNPHDIQILCKINGQVKQSQSTANLLFGVSTDNFFLIIDPCLSPKLLSPFQIPELIAYMSQYMTLEPNDLILTGTPKGAGQVRAGDKIECELGDILKFEFNVQDDVE